MSNRESGYAGRIVSLAGIQGRPGHGLYAPSTAYSLSAVESQSIESNAKRVWLLISNTGPGNLRVRLAATAVGGHIVYPGGAVLINKEMPWSGMVTLYADGDLTGMYTEAEIIQ